MSDILNIISDYEEAFEEEKDSIENARAEFEELLALLERCLPYVEDMVGIASDARFLKAQITNVLMENKP